MATCRSVPRRPTAKDAAAITAGPVRKRTAMANVATLFPHAMIRGCSAMNSPARRKRRRGGQSVTREHMLKIHLLFHRWTGRAAREHGPRLNMAMPRPASERIEMDLRMIAGISKFHLHARRAEQISEGPNRMERHW